MRHEYSLAHLTVLSLTPPQLVEVAARTGYEYVGVRITRVTPAEVLYDLARDRALMRETKARLADTGDRGPRRRAVPDGSRARARALRAGARRDRRARREAHHRAAARPGSRARDRALRAALRSRAAARPLREPRVPALDGDRDAVGSGARRARRQPAQRRHSGRHAAFRALAIRAWTSSRSCRASGSASRTSATRRSRCRRRWKASSGPRATSGSSPARAASPSARSSRGCRRTFRTRWRFRGWR